MITSPETMWTNPIVAQDFFTVSLTVTDLAEAFDRSKTDITWGITLVLMFRSVGAVTFGIAADRYGRKVSS
jgi:SHS family lactate transporter-like MFS transporter